LNINSLSLQDREIKLLRAPGDEIFDSLLYYLKRDVKLSEPGKVELKESVLYLARRRDYDSLLEANRSGGLRVVYGPFAALKDMYQGRLDGEMVLFEKRSSEGFSLLLFFIIRRGLQ